MASATKKHQFGVTIPFRGWTFDADTFRTSVHNFFDHDVIGESNLFFPLTIQKRADSWMGSHPALAADCASRRSFISPIRTRSRRPAAQSPEV